MTGHRRAGRGLPRSLVPQLTAGPDGITRELPYLVLPIMLRLALHDRDPPGGTLPAPRPSGPRAACRGHPRARGHAGAPGAARPVSSFIGRTAERTELAAALAEHRMVTATGPGGVGKTRLALSVAAEAAPEGRDGVWFVDLVHETDPAMVTATVAQAVGVPEQSTSSLDLALIAALAERDALLVLDNCEHVLDGVRDCAERILAGCPDIRVLATSRTRLLVPYEWLYAVPGLSPGDAVDLFTARVAAATGGPAALNTRRVAALCEALDGMALAIELAAARYPTLGLDGLEDGLHERLRFLTGGGQVAARHRSLRDAIAWSYDLLAPDDRALLRGIAVFASWFDVGAAPWPARPASGRRSPTDSPGWP